MGFKAVARLGLAGGCQNGAANRASLFVSAKEKPSYAHSDLAGALGNTAPSQPPRPCPPAENRYDHCIGSLYVENGVGGRPTRTAKMSTRKKAWLLLGRRVCTPEPSGRGEARPDGSRDGALSGSLSFFSREGFVRGPPRNFTDVRAGRVPAPLLATGATLSAHHPGPP